MLTRLRWLTVLLPVLLIGVIEVLSDAYLDAVLPSPLDMLLVPVVVLALAWAFSRFAFREIDRLAAAVRARNVELESRSAVAAELHRVSVGVAALVEIDAILHTVVESARGLLGADVAVLVLVRPDGALALGAASGPPEAVRVAGDSPGSDFRRFVEPDYLHVQLAAPLQRGDSTIGTLAVGAREERSYGIQALETLSSLATQAAVVLENDRLQQEIRELAVRAERERIAREMHDGLAQVLGYVNTKSQAVEELLASGRTDAARAQLAELSTAARSVYIDIREAILGLSSPVDPGRGLVGALEEYGARFTDASKIATLVDAPDEVRALRLPVDVQAQVFRIVQEALTNVRKHAAAHRVVVSLAVTDDALVVAVDDDGRGYEPTRGPSSGWPRFGVQAMRDRTVALGGSMEIVAQPGSGTSVRLQIPLAATWTPA